MKSIPNILTLANAAVGCFALYFLSILDFDAATYCVLICCAFDFLDGFLARQLRATSPLGTQLDSLADAISFGVLPGVVASMMLLFLDLDVPWLFAGFMITVASVYRLATYNVSVQNQHYFSGLPTPANTLLWIGFTHVDVELNVYVVVGAILFTTFLLNSKLAFYRLHFTNTLFSIGIVSMAILLLIFLFVQYGHFAWSIAISTYIIFSLILSVFTSSRR